MLNCPPMKAPKPAGPLVLPAPKKTLDCAGQIVRLINSGAVVPGRRIGESSLAARLKFPRAAVRSALDHLEATGLLERRPRSGTFLREIPVAEFCDVMDIRAALEALAASQAALRASDKEIRNLEKQVDAVDNLNRRFTGGDAQVISRLTQRDLEFHLSLAALSGNSRLVTALRQQRLIEFTFTLVPRKTPFRPRRDRPIPTHREIVEAIASRNPHLAAQTARRHILRTKEAHLGSFAGEME